MMLTRNFVHGGTTPPELISNRTNKTQDVAQLRGRSPGANEMTSVYERLKNLQITLPDVPPPVVDGYVAAFVPFVRTGTSFMYLGGSRKRKESHGPASWGRTLP
jgi:hypothetical protein